MSKLKTSEINAQVYIGDTKPTPTTNIPEAYIGRLYYAKDVGITYRLSDDTQDANVWVSLETPSEIISADEMPTFNDVPDGSIWNDTHKYDAQSGNWLIIKDTNLNVPVTTYDKDAGYDIGHEIVVGTDVYRLWDNKVGNAVWARLDSSEPNTTTPCTPTGFIGYGSTLYVCYGNGNWYNEDTNTLVCNDDPTTINPLPKNAIVVKGDEKWHTDENGNLKIDVASRVPTSADDVDAGYKIGDVWEVTPSGDKYRCIDATAGNAEWAIIRYTAPTATDDVDAGFEVGDKWYNDTNGKVYKCLDNTDDNAVWTEQGSGIASSANRADEADSLTSQLSPSNTLPTQRDNGDALQANDFYFEPQLNKTVTYDGSKFKLEGQVSGEYLGNFDTTNEPTANNTGDRYINTDNDKVMEWNGTDWEEVVYKADLDSIPDANESTKGIIEIATQAEVDAGTDDERAITPKKFNKHLKENGLLVIDTNTTFTVGSGGDYPDYPTAIDDILKTYLIRDGVFVTLEAVSGYVITKPIVVNGRDLSKIRITSVDSQISVNGSSLVNNTDDDSKTVYAVIISNTYSVADVLSKLKGKAPKIQTGFDCINKPSGADIYYSLFTGQLEIVTTKTISNFDTGINIENGLLFMQDVTLDNNGEVNIRSSSCTANISSCIIKNTGNNVLIKRSNVSVIDTEVSGATANYELLSDNGSNVKIDNCTFDSGSYASLSVQDGSSLTCWNTTLSNGQYGVWLGTNSRAELRNCTYNGQSDKTFSINNSSSLASFDSHGTVTSNLSSSTFDTYFYN